MAVLVPPIQRARSQHVRGDTVGAFRHGLNMLGHTNGHRRGREAKAKVQPIFAPVATSAACMSSAQRRRRDVLGVLLSACAATQFQAVLTRMTMLFALHLVADAVLMAYVYLLVQVKARTQGPRARVQFFDAAYRQPSPSSLGDFARRGGAEARPLLVPLRRTASN
jgi:hypothetical protein